MHISLMDGAKREESAARHGSMLSGENLNAWAIKKMVAANYREVWNASGASQLAITEMNKLVIEIAKSLKSSFINHLRN